MGIKDLNKYLHNCFLIPQPQPRTQNHTVIQVPVTASSRLGYLTWPKGQGQIENCHASIITYVRLSGLNRHKNIPFNGKVQQTGIHHIKRHQCQGPLHGIIVDVLMDKLQKSQSTAARIVTLTGGPSHITPVLRDLHWLSIRQRVDFKIILTVYKALHGLAPAYIANLLSSYKPERHLRSRKRGLLQKNRTNLSTAGDHAFEDYASRGCFKNTQNLKTTLFKFAYN